MVCFVIVGCNTCGSCTSNIPQRKKWSVPLCLGALLPEFAYSSANQEKSNSQLLDGEVFQQAMTLVDSIGHWARSIVSPVAVPVHKNRRHLRERCANARHYNGHLSAGTPGIDVTEDGVDAHRDGASVPTVSIDMADGTCYERTALDNQLDVQPELNACCNGNTGISEPMEPSRILSSETECDHIHKLVDTLDVKSDAISLVADELACPLLTFSTERDSLRSVATCRACATNFTIFAIALRFPQRDRFAVFSQIPFPWLPGPPTRDANYGEGVYAEISAGASNADVPRF